MSRRWFVSLTMTLLVAVPAGQADARDDWARESSAGRPREEAASGPRRIQEPVFRLDVPFRTQKDGSRWQVSNCGPATLGMVLDAFGAAGQATDDLRLLAHTYQGTVGSRTGTALQHIAQVAEDFGVPTVGLYEPDGRFHSWSLDEIREQLRLGRPVMPLVRFNQLPDRLDSPLRWGHYILLTGLAEGGFFYSDSLQTDPAVGAGRLISDEQLERAIRSSHISGQAVAFAGPSTAASPKVWTPGS